MEKIVGTENWIDLLKVYTLNKENQRIEQLKRSDINGSINGYFKNTVVFRDGNGKITSLIYYNADGTMCYWCNGAWFDGRWIINTGQDNTLVFHVFTIDEKKLCFCHPFAADKKVGDYWISPETPSGIPVFPYKHTPLMHLSSVPVTIDGKRFKIEGTDLDVGAVYSLEEGFIDPPKERKPALFKDFMSAAAVDANKPIESYWGNTDVLLDFTTGKVMGLGYYRSDFSLRHWNNGTWINGSYIVNNGQDCSMFIRTRSDFFNRPAGFAHPFAPNKKVGDCWVSPEVWSGIPPYPLTTGGVPVAKDQNNYYVAGTEYVPGWVHVLENGEVPPPEKD